MSTTTNDTDHGHESGTGKGELPPSPENVGKEKERQDHVRIGLSVFYDLFWRDVVYAILPLVVLFFITLLNGGSLDSILYRPEWLFAAIVFLGLTIATVSQKSGPSVIGDNKRDTPAAPYLFVVIGAAVLLGVVMYEQGREQMGGAGQALRSPARLLSRGTADADSEASDAASQQEPFKPTETNASEESATEPGDDEKASDDSASIPHSSQELLSDVVSERKWDRKNTLVAVFQIAIFCFAWWSLWSVNYKIQSSDSLWKQSLRSGFKA